LRFKQALDLLDRAAVEPKEEKAKALRQEARTSFEESVQKPIDALVAGLEAKVAENRKKATSEVPPAGGRREARETPREVTDLLRSLEYTELNRLKFILSYARGLPEGSSERTAALERGLKLAETFVNTRYDFPVMQLEAQLQLGLCQYELGRYQAAEDSLGLLFDVEPPFAPPFPKDIVDSFKRLRLQAILFGARAMSARKQFAKAARAIEQFYLPARKDEFDLTRCESEPELRTDAIMVRLEYGLALAGDGQVEKGLGEIQKVIRQPEQPAPLVTEARRALGKLAAEGRVKLRGRDYYEAALGLKSALRFEPALISFQRALSSLDSGKPKESLALAPLCLNEIGEVNFLLGRFVESAVAYQEVCEYFPEAPNDILSKAATNFLAATTRAIKTTEGGTSHAGLARLREAADRQSEKHSSGFAVFESRMFDAGNLQAQGKWDEAIAKYEEVQPTLDKKKVPFYW